MNYRSQGRVNLPVLLLTLLTAASLSAFYLQWQKAGKLSQENESLRGMTNELERLRAENKEIPRLREETQEVEQLRRDNRDLYRLRNEVHQLTEEKEQWEKANGTSSQPRPRDDRAVSSAVARSTPNANPAPRPTTTPNPSSTTASTPAPEGPPRPWLGFYYVKIPPTMKPADSNGEELTGALISLVKPGSPADQAGLQVDDIVTSYDGHPVHTVADLASLSKDISIGQSVTIDLLREGRQLRFVLKVEARPPTPPKPVAN